MGVIFEDYLIPILETIPKRIEFNANRIPKNRLK